MAVFLLKALEGSAYDPPDCAGIFNDVTCTPGTGFSDWIEELADRGITGGCLGGTAVILPDEPEQPRPDGGVSRQDVRSRALRRLSGGTTREIPFQARDPRIARSRHVRLPAARLLPRVRREYVRSERHRIRRRRHRRRRRLRRHLAGVRRRGPGPALRPIDRAAGRSLSGERCDDERPGRVLDRDGRAGPLRRRLDGRRHDDLGAPLRRRRDTPWARCSHPP